MQRDMIHMDSFMGMMPVRDHREFKIKVHNAICDVEQGLHLPFPSKKKELTGDRDLTAESVLNLIQALTDKVNQHVLKEKKTIEDEYSNAMSAQKKKMEEEMKNRDIAFADATVQLHDRWTGGGNGVGPKVGPKGKLNPYLINSPHMGLTPKGTKTFVDPKPIKAKNKKEMLERWEAMKKELEAEGYTNIHSRFQ